MDVNDAFIVEEWAFGGVCVLGNVGFVDGGGVDLGHGAELEPDEWDFHAHCASCFHVNHVWDLSLHELLPVTASGDGVG